MEWCFLSLCFFNDTGKNIAYIGQASGRTVSTSSTNIIEHKRNLDKNYWTEAVVFTTSNSSFIPIEISYLENKFCNLAIKANRYIVKNGNNLSSKYITEEKSELEEFVNYTKLIKGILGHKIFVSLNKTATTTKDITDTTFDEIKLLFTRTIKKFNFTAEATAKADRKRLCHS